MIIVEGPDGAGKTTLVKKLCERLGLREGGADVDRDTMADHTKQRAFKALADCVYGATPPRVYDRVFFSELVYGPVWRDGVCAFTSKEQSYYEEMLRFLDVPVIWCLPEYEIVERNVDSSKDGQLLQVAGTLPRLYERYVQCANRFVGNGYTYDYVNTDLDYFLQMAIDPYLDTRKKRTWQA